MTAEIHCEDWGHRMNQLRVFAVKVSMICGRPDNKDGSNVFILFRPEQHAYTGGAEGAGGKNSPCMAEVEPGGLAGSCLCCGLCMLFHFS